MTRILLALCLLLCAGCATTNGGGVTHTGRAFDARAGAPLSKALAAPADSAWLHFSAPSFGSWDCAPDSAHPLRDYQRVFVLRLKGQAPSWYRGAEADSAAWELVRRECAPDTIWSAWVAPGARCSVRVGSGEYITPVARQRCGWRVVRVP